MEWHCRAGRRSSPPPRSPPVRSAVVATGLPFLLGTMIPGDPPAWAAGWAPGCAPGGGASADANVKAVAETLWDPGSAVTTVTGSSPSVSPSGTTITMTWSDQRVIALALPPTVTWPVPEPKLVPWITTTVPLPPVDGVRETMVGTTWKVTAPGGRLTVGITVNCPVAAPSGTVTLICVADHDPTGAGTPPICTAPVAGPKPEPVICTRS